MSASFRYKENVKGCCLYNPNTKSIIITRNVEFDEGTQDQEGAPPPANDTFIELQLTSLKEDQTLTQTSQNTQHCQLQQNVPTIGVPTKMPN